MAAVALLLASLAEPAVVLGAPGDLLWSHFLPDTAYYGAATDGSRIYAVGRTVSPENGSFDLILDGYDTATGTFLGQNRFEGGGNESAGAWVAGDVFHPEFLRHDLVRVHGNRVVVGGLACPGGPPDNCMFAGGGAEALLRVYDATSGVLVWARRELPVPNSSDDLGTMAIDVGGGRVFMATAETIRAYDLGTGAVLWADALHYDWHNEWNDIQVSALRVAGKHVFAGIIRQSSSCPDYPDLASCFPLEFVVRAYDAATGTLVWENQVSGGAEGFYGIGGDAAPFDIVVDGNRVFALGQGEFPQETFLDYLASDTSYYHLRAIDEQTGATLWDDPGGIDTPNIFALTLARGLAVAAGGGRVFGVGYTAPSGNTFDGTRFFVRAHDEATGAVLWQDELAFGPYSGAYQVLYDPGLGAPQVVGGPSRGRVPKARLVVAGFGTDVFGDGVALVRAYDPATGALEWHRELSTFGKRDEFLALARAGRRVLAVGTSSAVVWPGGGDPLHQDGLIAAYGD